MNTVYTKYSNGETVFLNLLTDEELDDLHYSEETLMVKIIKRTEPFSQERKDLLNQLYQRVLLIKSFHSRYEKENTDMHKKYYYNLSNKYIEKSRGRKKLVASLPHQLQINIFELGCGNCILLGLLSNNRNYNVSGCDLYPNTDKDNNIKIYQDDIYNCLRKLEDKSIDCFIADNVCEHFFEDEADEIYSLIHKKLTDSGRCVFIIPDLLVGPSDISGLFLPLGSKATGTHFMEQTYCENIKLLKKNGFVIDCLSIKLSRGQDSNILYIKNLFDIPNRIKMLIEPLLAKLHLNTMTKKRIFNWGGYNIYLLKKQNNILTS